MSKDTSSLDALFDGLLSEAGARTKSASPASSHSAAVQRSFKSSDAPRYAPPPELADAIVIFAVRVTCSCGNTWTSSSAPLRRIPRQARGMQGEGVQYKPLEAPTDGCHANGQPLPRYIEWRYESAPVCVECFEHAGIFLLAQEPVELLDRESHKTASFHAQSKGTGEDLFQFATAKPA